jgi:hypothetical protein
VVGETIPPGFCLDGFKAGQDFLQYFDGRRYYFLADSIAGDDA